MAWSVFGYGWERIVAKSSLISLMMVVAMALGACGGQGSDPTGFEPPKLPSGFAERVGGIREMQPLGLAAMDMLIGTHQDVQFGLQQDAYSLLIDGELDLVLAGSPQEIDYKHAERSGVELDIQPLVKDGLVFMISPENPVTDLSRRQIQQVYSAAVTNWSQIGGADEPIVAYQDYEDNAYSADLMLELVADETSLMTAPQAYFSSELNLYPRLAAYDNSAAAIGYAMYSYPIEVASKDTIKLLAIDQITPSVQTIADGSYPYIAEFYVAVRADSPKDSPARQVRDWLLSSAGQQLAARTHYVPLDLGNAVKPEPVFGFSGSTPENTTSSSGTGGSEPKSVVKVPDSQIQCSINAVGKLESISIQDASAMAQAITNWYAQQSGVGGCETVSVRKDLATVFVANSDETTRSVTYTRAAISSDGKVLRLSDFFYDRVNYISFINQNLFNRATNWQFITATEQRLDLSAAKAFTGLPNDYQDFGAYVGLGGIALTFDFAQDNPFFTRAIDNVGINLPADLSPYGRIWYQVDLPGTNDEWIYPKIETKTTGDDELNTKIAALHIAHPDMTCFHSEIGVNHLTILAYRNQDKCLKFPYVVAIPQAVAQWELGTWEDSHLTIKDLPAPWQQTYSKEAMIGFGFGIVCPVARRSDDDCNVLSDDNQPVLTPQAKVTKVWQSWDTSYAIIEDGKWEYLLSYR